MISAFGSSVLLLLSEEADQLGLDLHSCIILVVFDYTSSVSLASSRTLASQMQRTSCCAVQTKCNCNTDYGWYILEVTSSLAGRRFLLSLSACLAGRGGLRPTGSSSSSSCGVAALQSKDLMVSMHALALAEPMNNTLKGLSAHGEPQHT